MSTTSSKISHFISRTGSSSKVAQELLKENHWNVDCAVNAYKLMNEASLMPKKNVNAKQNCLDTSQSAASRHLSHDFRATNKVKPAAQDFCKNSSELLTLTNRNDNNSGNKGKQRVSEVQVRHVEVAQELRSLPSEDNSDSTFILPDFSSYPDDFRNFLDKDLIETSTLDLLMKAGRLNWWSEFSCQPLFPLVTTGDGNCLLHAASLALWGHQDTDLALRKRLFDMMLESPHHDSFFRRWKWHQMQINKQSELVYSDQEWQEEWNSLVKLASPQPRITSCNMEVSQGLNSAPSNHDHLNGAHNSGHTHQFDQQEIQYESLEELHIFVLAHLLQRPIIITADTILRDSGGEALAPITFGGVYLPLEHPPLVCHRYPILLTYDAAHFSALVPTEDSFQLSVTSRASDDCHAFSGSVPLVDINLELLPVHFVRDPGPNYNWNEEKTETADQSEKKAKEGNGVELENGTNGAPTGAEDKVTLTEKVSALRKYLSIEVVLVPPLANSISSLDSSESVPIHDNSLEKMEKSTSQVPVAGGPVEDLDASRVSDVCGKGCTEQADLANGRTGMESFPKTVDHLISNDLVADEKSKREKTKGLSRLRKIAKSVSANFKRSFHVKNSIKNSSNKASDAGSRDRQPSTLKSIKSLESPTGSPELSNAVFFIVDSLERKTRIPCAKLLYKRQDYQTEIIKNYLEQAYDRFIISRKREMERMQAHPMVSHHQGEKSFEFFHRSAQQATGTSRHVSVSSSATAQKSQTSPVECVNTGCSGRATSDTCYLCTDCYEKQKSEEAKLKSNNNVNNHNINNSFACCREDGPEKKSAKPSDSNKVGFSRTTLEMGCDIPGKPTKNIVSSATLKSSLSDDFGSSSSSRIVLEKNTRVDNRMLVATETTESDFLFGRAKAGSEVKAEIVPSSDRSRQGSQVPAKTLPNVEEVEKSDRLPGPRGGKCSTEGCSFYGSQLTNNYCSSCYRKKNVS